MSIIDTCEPVDAAYAETPLPPYQRALSEFRRAFDADLQGWVDHLTPASFRRNSGTARIDTGLCIPQDTLEAVSHWMVCKTIRQGYTFGAPEATLKVKFTVEDQSRGRKSLRVSASSSWSSGGGGGAAATKARASFINEVADLCVRIEGAYSGVELYKD